MTRSHICMHIYGMCTCLGRDSHDGVVAPVTGHGGGAMNAQSVAYVRGNLGLGELGAGSRRGAQVSAIGRGDPYRRLRRGCDRAEIGDRATVAAGSLLLLLLLRVFQRGKKPRTPPVMQSSICTRNNFENSNCRSILVS